MAKILRQGSLWRPDTGPILEEAAICRRGYREVVPRRLGGRSMSFFVTFLIFTAAFAAAAEYALWAPKRRLRMDIEQRLRGLRVDGGRRSMSLLRQQQTASISFISRLQLMKGLQAMIDQARLPYRAGNVLTLQPHRSRLDLRRGGSVWAVSVPHS